MDIIIKKEVKYISCKCVHCSKMFYTDNLYEHFCSKECWSSSNVANKNNSMWNDNKVIIKECSVCKAKYVIGHTKYCKSTCSDSCERIKIKSREVIYIRNCICCGITYRTHKDNVLTCSKGCDREYKFNNNRIILKHCQVCDKPFKTNKMNRFTCGKEECIKVYKKILSLNGYLN